ncbi:27937d94-0899-437a-814c-a63c371db4f5 [Sclerotinia trifoliorum]|uniref:27937d94-0899-437a-814c-a63c371db4f5 n=1 Tax=Sclerotinia trifoliorum TaxID=28548 RepID=A0A8H2VQG4_9HELO|nr:27937d94-0899-437a-814c-a63c371db4f5 [Sclerotinia trifoliorum]
MADQPTVPNVFAHRHASKSSISSTNYTVSTPATTDRSIAPISADENPILHPRKFDFVNDTELYIHENRVIPRLFFYEPALEMQISRLKMLKEGYFVGHPRTLVFSVAGAVTSVNGDDRSRGSEDGGELFRAAYSLHFGPGSKYNSSGKIKETGSKIEMQKIAELAAACEALEFVERKCKMRVSGFEDVSGEIALGGLVVAVTSSTNLWYGITEHIFKWKRNGFHNSKGGKVAGEELWKRLDECMNRFEFNQMRVAWLLCEKEENQAEEAAQLEVSEA